MTDFPGRTERHWGGMVEGHEPSLDPAQPAVSPVQIHYVTEQAQQSASAQRNPLPLPEIFFAKTFHGKVPPFRNRF
jgi:hypothetical protein